MEQQTTNLPAIPQPQAPQPVTPTVILPSNFDEFDKPKKSFKIDPKTGILVGGVTFLVGYYGYKAYKLNKRRRFVAENSHLPIVQDALAIHHAMIGDLYEQSFLSRLFFGQNPPNGTDEDTVYEIITKNNDFKALSKAYTDISGRNLMADITSELNNEEYRKALGLISLEKHYEATKDKPYEKLTPLFKGDKIVVTNPEGAKIYKYTYKNGIYTKGDVLKTVPKGKEYEIHHVLNNSDMTRIHYKICDGWTLFGYCQSGDALINHRDIKKL